MQHDEIRLALVTLNPKYGEPEANRDAIIEWLNQAASRTANLVVFPEAILTSYDLDHKKDIAIHADDDLIEDIAQCAELHGCVASIGFIEKDEHGYYTSQIYVGEGIRQVYRKCHLTSWEKEHCLPGNELSVQTLPGIVTGTQICYDSAFPRASEHLVRSGAELLITPTCNGVWIKDLEKLGGKKAVLKERQQHVRKYWAARAYDFGVYTAYVENVGETKVGAYHPGYAVIYGPDGEVINERCSAREGMISALIYPKQLPKLRTQHGHHKCLPDARPELYSELNR